MAGYAKLFSSIVDSTIWREAMHIKVVWITLLAKADKAGIVQASVPGLADAARVSMEQCVEALESLKAPDEWSRTKDFEGRRILEIEGGWVLLNYLKYRDIKDDEEIREKTRLRVQKFREKHGKQVTDVTSSNTEKHGETQNNDIAEADTKAEAEARKDSPLPPKGESVPKVPSWAKALPLDVINCATEILMDWPDPRLGDVQPWDSHPAVPPSSKPELCRRLVEIKKAGAKLDVCVAIAARFKREYREDGGRMKAAENFFGKAKAAPWQAYYQAHATNQTLSQPVLVSQ